MHLLFISSMLPEDEPRSGFEIANRAIADEYRRQGVRLSFAGFRRPGSRLPRPGEIALGELLPETADAGPARRLGWLGRALGLGLPVSAAKLATMHADALSERLGPAGDVDGYLLNSIQMPTAYPFLAGAKPSIFVAHNVEHLSAAENARHTASALRRRLYRREAKLLREAELRVCREARVVHAFSADDLAGLGLAGSPNAFVTPLGVGRARAADETARDFDVGLIGTWSWAPNRIGLDWFLGEVVPFLPVDITVAVAGGFDGPPPRVPPNVRLLGRVPDAQRFVRSCGALALAARGGTGVQLKTIEAFEEGMPAVATRSAVRGIARVPANVVVADEAAAFASALAGTASGVRAGRIGRVDGALFAAEQRRALAEAVGRGIARLEGIVRVGRIRIARSSSPDAAGAAGVSTAPLDAAAPAAAPVLP